MEKFKMPNGIYAITDSECSKGKNFKEYCKELLENGVKIIQYREKYKKFEEQLNETKILRELTQKYNAIFIVNDSIELAKISKADGIHIGQDDASAKDVRKQLGENVILGISVSNEKELEKAILDGADYVGIGPIFNTTTKKDIKQMADLKLIKIAQKLAIEYTVIGGIKETNMDKLLNMGVKNLCIISDILSSSDIKEKMRRLNNILKNYI